MNILLCANLLSEVNQPQIKECFLNDYAAFFLACYPAPASDAELS